MPLPSVATHLISNVSVPQGTTYKIPLQNARHETVTVQDALAVLVRRFRSFAPFTARHDPHARAQGEDHGFVPDRLRVRVTSPLPLCPTQSVHTSRLVRPFRGPLRSLAMRRPYRCQARPPHLRMNVVSLGVLRSLQKPMERCWSRMRRSGQQAPTITSRCSRAAAVLGSPSRACKHGAWTPACLWCLSARIPPIGIRRVRRSPRSRSKEAGEPRRGRRPRREKRKTCDTCGSDRSTRSSRLRSGRRLSPRLVAGSLRMQRSDGDEHIYRFGGYRQNIKILY